MNAKQVEERPLAGKVALVTGAAGAIGFGVCRMLLENGCKLAASDLPGEKLDGLVHDLEKLGSGTIIGIGIDVTKPESVAAGFQQVTETLGGLNLLVHNAGIALVSKLIDMDLEAFRKLERVNVEGTLLTLAEAARVFIRQGTGGDIVIMSTKNVPSPSAGFDSVA